MKKIALMAVAAIAAIIPTLVKAQEYVPILEKGRMWVLSNQPTHIHENFTPVDVATVGNDTIVEGRNCMTIEIKSLSLDGIEKSEQIVCEEDGRLWWWNEASGKFFLMIDMSAEDGDVLPLYSGDDGGEESGACMVKDEGEIDIWDSPRKVLSIYSEGSSAPLTYWVEGVGSTSNIYETTFSVHMGDSTYLTQCFNEGKWECFSLREFEDKLPGSPQTGMECLSSDNEDGTSATYDLKGIRIQEPASGSIYVKDRSLRLKN